MTQKTYSVKEMYLTLQGEGGQTGRAAVFVRFSGCNLWSGHERGRPYGNGGCSAWCDTDFVGTDGPNGGRYTGRQLVAAAEALWHVEPSLIAGGKLAVLTGGEPTLQVDMNLVELFWLAAHGVAIETNGTRAVPNGIDWICVSPKAKAIGTVEDGYAGWVQRHGQDLKLIYPQPGLAPDEIDALRSKRHLRFRRYYLQPLWTADADQWQANIGATIEYVRTHPWWALSLQTHKALGLP